MKKVILFIALSTFGIHFMTAQDAPQQGTTITVSVDNVPNDKGNVMFALYDEQTFMKAGPIKSAKSAIKDGKVKITFENVEPGTYAVLCYHDENENQQMDFEDNGMPKESYGASNNAMSYGPPSFTDAKFEVGDEPLELDIRF